MTNWKKYPENKPENGIYYFVFSENAEAVSYYYNGWSDHYYYDFLPTPTHFMEITYPEPPKTEEG